MKLQDFDFRVWDDIEKELLYPSKDYRLTLGFSNPELSSNGESLLHAYYDGEPFCPDGCEIELYTGLKDKKGVKIFEGDIVRDRLGLKGVVKFLNGVFYIFLNGYAEAILENYAESIVVIGNIHENADLLK